MGKLTNIIGTGKAANNCEMCEIRMDRKWGETMLIRSNVHREHLQRGDDWGYTSIDVDWIRIDWIRIDWIRIRMIESIGLESNRFKGWGERSATTHPCVRTEPLVTDRLRSMIGRSIGWNIDWSGPTLLAQESMLIIVEWTYGRLESNRLDLKRLVNRSRSD